ncbi:L-aminoadipate-semialdehyde dehydrogenase-phosphopantetheinyl transferase [Orchesella cincta]|uniref:L-aminoadipate-semialdehyde dehydrogenase-phosphopantetheinyl transferase n=1 Tax=Orchesella cincta TaxID=48709 RepID=A0A1D2N5D6_ORCCI|nr:L-aminoadipate-semialdehyde dehydrogenase-phosphopantetheinyl transferase [Orchesella cincta]
MVKKDRRKKTFKIIRSFLDALFPLGKKTVSEMSVRWSFKANQWEPTRSQLLQISSIIQPEEKARIARFHFISDAKSSLIGRLLIRKLVNVKTGAPNDVIKLARDEHNKPILISPKFNELLEKPENNEVEINHAQENEEVENKDKQDSSCDSPAIKNLNFNVSHQGKFVVLVSEPSAVQVGIDVMNVEKPGRITESVDDYFRLMNRQFTENEWEQIKTLDGSVPHYFHNKAKLTNFTRFWCLKESYVKAVGVGIVIDLRSIDFTTKSELGSDLVTDTTIKVNGVPSPEWKFEERFLDDLHIVTVAKCYALPDNENNGDPSCVPDFENVTLDFLTEGMTTLGDEDQDWVDEFLKKK